MSSASIPPLSYNPFGMDCNPNFFKLFLTPEERENQFLHWVSNITNIGNQIPNYGTGASTIRLIFFTYLTLTGKGNQRVNCAIHALKGFIDIGLHAKNKQHYLLLIELASTILKNYPQIRAKFAKE